MEGNWRWYLGNYGWAGSAREREEHAAMINPVLVDHGDSSESS